LKTSPNPSSLNEILRKKHNPHQHVDLPIIHKLKQMRRFMATT
jgi:hypothetical protein